MWYCCDLQKQITKEHIKIFGAVSARCLKCFGGTEELMVITSRHALPFLKDSNGLLIWLLLHILVYRKVIINILLKKKTLFIVVRLSIVSPLIIRHASPLVQDLRDCPETTKNVWEDDKM